MMWYQLCTIQHQLCANQYQLCTNQYPLCTNQWLCTNHSDAAVTAGAADAIRAGDRFSATVAALLGAEIK